MLAIVFLVILVGGIVLAVWNNKSYSKTTNLSYILFGWGIACSIVGGILTIIVWPIIFLTSMSSQANVDAFVRSQIHVEFLAQLKSKESLIDLEPVGENLKRWYHDVKNVNETINWHNLCNDNFWLDQYVSDWEAPDLITFEK